MSAAKPLPWFRMYNEAIDDEKLRLVAFEDRWHFVAILCCKAQGILDSGSPIVHRLVAVKLGIDQRTLDDVARRLAEVGLIDEKTLQPLAWENRQMRSDSSTERVRAYREKLKRTGNVSETAQEVDTEEEKEGEKEKDKSIAPAQAPATATPIKRKAPEAALPAPPAVSPDVWRDFVKHRGAKKSPINETVVRLLTKELARCAEAGISPDDALSEAMAAGWLTPKADWLRRRMAPSSAPAQANRQNRAEQGKADFLRIIGQEPDNTVIDMGDVHAYR